MAACGWLLQPIPLGLAAQGYAKAIGCCRGGGAHSHPPPIPLGNVPSLGHATGLVSWSPA
eukprot:242660-Heterocapsa_arctica.AAC.1